MLVSQADDPEVDVKHGPSNQALAHYINYIRPMPENERGYM